VTKLLNPKIGWIPVAGAVSAVFLILAIVFPADWPKVGLAGFVLACVFLVAAVQLFVLLSGVDSDVDLIAGELSSDNCQQRLVARWLSKARWARNVGGLAGVCIWAVGTEAGGSLLIWGFGGITIGAMVAEFHHIRPSRGRRTATLVNRSVSDYLPSSERRRMMGVAVGAIVIGILGFVLGGTSVHWWSIAALAVLGLSTGAQRRVARRPRSGLPIALRYGDDTIRKLAISRGLARPSSYWALALLARGLSGFDSGRNGFVEALGVIIWIYAIYLWWNNRRLGLDYLLESAEPVPA